MVELAAGREFDAQVAEKVMGWRVSHGEQHDAWYCDNPFAAWNGSHVPAYSTNIAAAWQVVEHMNRTMPNEFQMMAEHGGYTAEFAEGKSHWAETASLAICRAALAAVGIA